MTRLALFDLDYTLLPLDSDYEWGRFLGRTGVVDAAAHEQKNAHYFAQYKAGTLDIQEFLKFSLSPLVGRPREELDRWHRSFMSEVIEPAIRPQALDLIARHRDDLCCIVTATNDFVTRPIATRLGIENLIATTAEQIDGRYTGRGSGQPSFQAGKIIRVEAWLDSLGRKLQDFERSWFYSDSMNDLPLLEKVTDPVVVNGDPKLKAVAQQRGWPTMELFA